MSEQPVSIAHKSRPPGPPRQKGRALEQVLGFFEMRVEDFKRKIMERDAPAIAAFNESQKDLHNLYCRAWPELSEDEKETWRKKENV